MELPFRRTRRIGAERAQEQSGRYQVAYASVHLAAVRYLLLFEAMLRQGRLSYGEIRDRETGRLQVLTYATLLWQLLRSLIEGALDGLVRQLGRRVINKVSSRSRSPISHLRSPISALSVPLWLITLADCHRAE